jgi:hypothetical protein
MAMYPCRKCLENRWSFEKRENFIFATCQSCAAEVSFQTRKSRRPPKVYVAEPPVFYPGFNTPGVPAATQPDPVRWAALEASFVDDGKAPWE